MGTTAHRPTRTTQQRTHSHQTRHNTQTNATQIDVISYDNITSSSPAWPALLGVNAQLAFVAQATARRSFSTLLLLLHVCMCVCL